MIRLGHVAVVISVGYVLPGIFQSVCNVVAIVMTIVGLVQFFSGLRAEPTPEPDDWYYVPEKAPSKLPSKAPGKLL